MSTPTRRTRSDCCASVASGHAAAVALSVAIKSRRLIGAPKGAGHGMVAICFGSLEGGRVSAWDHKQTFAPQKVMSALPPKADTRESAFAPKPEIELDRGPI